MPQWVKIFGLPLESWTEEGLNIVASGIGMPLYPDKRTTEKSRTGFARVCVEIEASKELVKELVVCCADSTTFSIFIDYDWLSKACSTCNCFEQTQASCSN